MSSIGGRVGRIVSASLPVTVAAVVGACLLPSDSLAPILTALLAWTCASVPIGVLVGHCTLTGNQGPDPVYPSWRRGMAGIRKCSPSS